jgi:hypothetical protein
MTFQNIRRAVVLISGFSFSLLRIDNSSLKTNCYEASKIGITFLDVFNDGYREFRRGILKIALSRKKIEDCKIRGRL